MTNVVGVRFRSAGKVYYFDPGDIELSDGDRVIVETVRGLECGEVVGEPRLVPDEEVAQPLKKVIRKAAPEDESVVEENREKERRAFKIGLEKIAAHGLPMKLVDVEYTFDGSKIIFFFTADGRVDFRELVKDLASVFRTRIELRQIGVRDEAKMLGGLGPCGRPLCCATFLRDFEPVSIRMAKDQNLSLNPAKISGICGRLMCCLKYEHEVYKNLRQALPPVGSEIDTEMGRGKITELDVLKGIASVKMEDGKTVRVDVREQDGSSRYGVITSRWSGPCGPCMPCGMTEKSQAPETEVEADLEDGHQLEDDDLGDTLSLIDRLAVARSESAAAAAVRERHDTVATDVDEPEGERERGTTPDAQARDATPAGAGVSAEARARASAGAGPGPANGDGAVAVVDSGRIRAARARKRRRRAKHGRGPGQPGAAGEAGKPSEVGKPGGSREQAAAAHARVSPGRRNARRARRAEQPDASGQSGQSGQGQSGQSGRPGKPGKPGPSGTSVRPSPSVQPGEVGQASGASPGSEPGPGPGRGSDQRRRARRRRRPARPGRGATVTPTAAQGQASAAVDGGSVATDDRSDRGQRTGTGR